MKDIYNNLPCIYFSTTVDGFIIAVNDFLCNDLGYKKEELIGQKLQFIFTLSTRIFQQTHFYPLLELEGIAEELSITVVPAAANFGANKSDVFPPAENKAISGLAAIASSAETIL